MPDPLPLVLVAAPLTGAWLLAVRYMLRHMED